MTTNDAKKLVVIVEDDADIARIIHKSLQDYGFETACFKNATEAIRRLKQLAPDLCIIDLGLPDMDGLEALRKIRSQSSCGNIILTGRTDVSDRVMGLELGADDYVTKPFEPRELIARVRSVMRRREEARNPNCGQMANFSDWVFNLENHQLISPDGEDTPLSSAEAELLKVFLRHPNQILHREKLVGSRDLNPSDRSIDVRISRLRRKLQPHESSPELIKTVYGAGYLFLTSVTWH